MLTMGAAAWLSVSLPDWSNFPGALFAVYLVATGWAAVTRNERFGRTTEHVALVIGGAAAACALLLAFQANASATGLVNGKPAPPFAIVAGLATFALTIDVYVMRSGGAGRSRPMARHVWRMCTALFFGTGSFFLGQQQTLPSWLQGSPLLFGLAFAPLVLMVFWLAKTIRLKPRLGSHRPSRSGSSVPADRYDG